MKLTGRKARLDPSNDRGAIIIIVAVGMVGLLGATALAFDLGNAWQARRELTNSTDAGALAAAASFAVGGDGCNEAHDYVLANDPHATIEDGWCVHVGS
ncbi:MAG: pilus assembly protein TadG-related protein, partial [Acidimicrobiales bacterium]